jgi:hypothetical protein
VERVSIIEGKTPVIFVAPHGAAGDDTNTAVITKSAAEAMNAYAVINRGWERADVFDYNKDKADCNNVEHCLEDVVKDEFLDPIIRFKNRIRKKHPWAWLFTIHGMGNDACIKAKDNSLSMVVGFGAGVPPSHTCKPWMKDLLIYQCGQHGWTSYEGKAGGKFAAWRKNNLCQYFRKWELDQHVHAMQLEIIYDLRDSKAKAQLCGECLADFIGEVINYGSWESPKNFTTKQF